MHRHTIYTLLAYYQGEIFMFDKKFLERMFEPCGLRKEQVATAIGITKQTLSGIETGYRAPSIEVAVALAEYFRIKIDDLVD